MKKVIAYIAILIVVITIDVLFSLDNINIFKSITQGVIITMIILSVNIRSENKQHPNKE
jgi:predicted tellurium resistance membrane protein TerC